ncbi:hypothetical protein BDV97DRAFT_346540 [Delphinella strobiligena]|nr:hypothetical protein BDV97DRAFT_346540 [Delphinella strobiligena]
MPTTRLTVKRENGGPGTGGVLASKRDSMNPSSKKNKAYIREAGRPSSTHGHSTNGMRHDNNNPQLLPVGKRLLPQVIDELAATDPHGIWLSLPRELDSAEIFEDIDYTRLANAVNRAAWWIVNQVGGACGVDGARTLAYLGPTDSRYLVFLIAAVKVGHRLLLPSLRNADGAQRKLYEATDCKVVLCAEGELRKVKETLSCFGSAEYTIHVVPEQHEILDPWPVKRYAYNKTFAEECHKSFVVIHTSGTSGEPRAIELPHSYYAYEDRFKDEFAKEGILTFAPLRPGIRCLYTGPLYHAGAILFTVMKSLFLKAVMLLPPAGVSVTAEVVESCLLHGDADVLGTAPSVLEELCALPTRRKCLESLSTIFCGSGPMPRSVGDALRSIDVNLLHVYGSSETGLMLQLKLEDPNIDWQYFTFHPASGATFVAIGRDDLHELVIKRFQGGTPQPCFEVFPHLAEYHTKDTFSQHPSKPGLWKFEGRIDDIITLSNGEKFCPLVTEAIVTSHSGVAEALVIGQGRIQPALVVSMRDPEKVSNGFVRNLWPLIEKANLQAPAYAQISRSFIIVTDNPFLKTPKGTIRRHQTEESLQSEIAAVYAHSEVPTPECHLNLDVRCPKSVESFLHDAISSTITIGERLSPEADLFAHGLDSLKVAEMVSFVNAALRYPTKATGGGAKRVGPPIFYQNRSIARLAAALIALFNSQDAVTADWEAWDQDRKVLLERYTRGFPKRPRQRRNSEAVSPSMNVVLLTGSTGSLGKHLLRALLRDTETKHVYCLDRSFDAKAKYLEAFPADKQMLTRVTFLQTPCLDARDLGVLDCRAYARLLEEVSTVIHNAWPVNAHLPLQSPPGHEGEDASFECHIAGVRKLVDFSAMATRRPQIVFVSSLSSVLRHASVIPEHIISDPAAPTERGYGRSKWLAEQILDMAAASGASNARSKIIRFGQIAGPSPDERSEHSSGSMWAANELIPSIIRSSATVKALPACLYAMEKLRWVPVTQAANIILDIAACRDGKEPGRTSTASIFNVTNLQTTQPEKTWKIDMLPLIKSRLEKTCRSSIDILPMQEWLSRVEKQGAGVTVGGGEFNTDNPAIRLIDIYEGLVGTDIHSGLGSEMEIRRAIKASQAFRNLGPVDLTWMDVWMEAWGL